LLEDIVYLGLGSNLGDRVAHLCAGLERLQRDGLRPRAVSSFYVTEPELGAPAADHPWYVNCVAAFESAPPPRRLLDLCLEVERREGRERPPRPAPGAGPEPRTLDIDILLIGERTVDEPGLTVPHPRLAERRFVLQPLAQIAPDARHPVTGATVRQMLAGLPPGPDVRLLHPQPQVAG
jgi:2-amino-4-hydroxy-6-hydroxymethyldihydropteridine diphosphokinase